MYKKWKLDRLNRFFFLQRVYCDYRAKKFIKYFQQTDDIHYQTSNFKFTLTMIEAHIRNNADKVYKLAKKGF